LRRERAFTSTMSGARNVCPWLVAINTLDNPPGSARCRSTLGVAQPLAFPGLRLRLRHPAQGAGHLGLGVGAAAPAALADAAALGLLAAARRRQAVRRLAVRQGGQRLARGG